VRFLRSRTTRTLGHEQKLRSQGERKFPSTLRVLSWSDTLPDLSQVVASGRHTNLVAADGLYAQLIAARRRHA